MKDELNNKKEESERKQNEEWKYMKRNEELTKKEK